MSGYQRITIVGNLGKDPELRFTQGGSPIGKMSVAVGERVKDGDDWKDHTEWFRVVAFGKTAENAGQYLKKGKKVLVEGRIRQRTYEKDDGSTGYSTELLADRIVFMSPKSEGEPDEAPRERAPAEGKKKPAAPKADEDVYDDDLPF